MSHSAGRAATHVEATVTVRRNLPVPAAAAALARGELEITFQVQVPQCATVTVSLPRCITVCAADSEEEGSVIVVVAGHWHLRACAQAALFPFLTCFNAAQLCNSRSD